MFINTLHYTPPCENPKLVTIGRVSGAIPGSTSGTSFDDKPLTATGVPKVEIEDGILESHQRVYNHSMVTSLASFQHW